MKKIITKIGMAVLLCTSALLFNGCKGKDGADGTPGATGPEGNANVSSMNFTSTTWSYNATTAVYWTDLNWSAITQDILDKGAVLVYQTANIGGTVNLQLPYTYYPSATYSETWSHAEHLGLTEIQVRDSDLTQPANPGSGVTFKVVVMTSKMMLTNPHINYNNYESVKKAYNLPD